MGDTRDEGQEAPRAGAAVHDSAFGRASLVGGVTLLRAPAFPVKFLGILAHWRRSCPRDFAMLRASGTLSRPASSWLGETCARSSSLAGERSRPGMGGCSQSCRARY